MNVKTISLQSLKYADFQDNTEYHHYKNDVKKLFPASNYYHIFPGSDIQAIKDPSVFSESIAKQILEKNLEIVIDFCRECHWEIIDFIYEYFILVHNIPPERITLLSASRDIKKHLEKIAEKHKLGKINLLYSSYFERVAKHLYLANIPNDIASPLKNKSFSKKYINLNRRWKTHRLALLSLLYQQGLLDEGYNSFPLISECVEQAPEDRKKYIKGFFLETKNTVIANDMNDDILYEILFNNTIEDYPLIKHLILAGKSVKERLPLKVDTDNFARDETRHLAYSDQKSLFKYARNSYFTLVTESNFNADTAILITEKTYKPIFYKHPFIILGPPNSLKRMHELGYKTFSDCIDESYDSEMDDSLRLEKIIIEVNRLCNLSENKLKDFCEKLLPVVNHNFTVLKSKTNFLLEI